MNSVRLKYDKSIHFSGPRGPFHSLCSGRAFVASDMQAFVGSFQECHRFIRQNASSISYVVAKRSMPKTKHKYRYFLQELGFFTEILPGEA